jgi:hypothetical protein
LFLLGRPLLAGTALAVLVALRGRRRGGVGVTGRAGRWRCAAVLGVEPAQLFGMAASEAPGAANFVRATKFVALGRIIARRSPVAHAGQFRRVEKL